MNLNNNKFKPGLYCVATPIGNMGDISFRAVKILQDSDLILCEDTRVTKKILQKFDINKKLISNHKFNENKNLEKVIEILKNNKIVSLVSDAGTPAVSDPGRVLVKECVKNKINIFPIPGASAVSSAISISGFSDNFYFCGFLPKKQTELEKFLAKTKLVKASLVFFMPARDLGKNSKFLTKYFPKSNFLIAREMTKVHETYIKDTIVNINKYVQDNDKGEMTLVIDNSVEEKTDINIDKEIKLLIGKMTSKNIAQYLSKKLEISKKIIYQKVIDLNE